ALGPFRRGVGIAVARVVTVLGSPQVVGPLIVVAAAYLFWRRWAVEALTLLVGFAARLGAVHLAKAIAARAGAGAGAGSAPCARGLRPARARGRGPPGGARAVLVPVGAAGPGGGPQPAERRPPGGLGGL